MTGLTNPFSLVITDRNLIIPMGKTSLLLQQGYENPFNPRARWSWRGAAELSLPEIAPFWQRDPRK